MVKLDRESLESIQAEFGLVDSSWQTEFNLRDTIKECFYLIENARKHKVSWERITEVIKKKGNITDAISPASVSKYYSEFAKNPASLPKKKRKAGSPKRNPIGISPEVDSPASDISRDIQLTDNAAASEESECLTGVIAEFRTEAVMTSEELQEEALIELPSESSTDIPIERSADINREIAGFAPDSSSSNQLIQSNVNPEENNDSLGAIAEPEPESATNFVEGDVGNQELSSPEPLDIPCEGSTENSVDIGLEKSETKPEPFFKTKEDVKAQFYRANRRT